MKIYLYAAAALILAGLLAYGTHIKHRADQADAAESALASYKAAVTARDKDVAEMQAADAERRTALAQRLDSVSAELDSLKANPPKASVKYVQLPGEACPQLHLDPEWVRDYNAASAASGPLPDPH